MIELTPEMREALDRRGDNRMSAYFFGFDSTTSDAVNDVLAAVAFAGKAFHSTEQWGDDDYMPFTMVDLIQATANEAADHIAKVEAERDALREGMELAWGVIANVSEGRWDEQTAEWVAAAERWRDEHWHAIPLDPENGER